MPVLGISKEEDATTRKEDGPGKLPPTRASRFRFAPPKFCSASLRKTSAVPEHVVWQ